MVVAAACLFAIGAASIAEANQEKTSPLDGTWRAVAAESNGETPAKEELEKIRLTIKGTKLTYQDGDFSIEGTIRFDAGKTPGTLDVEARDEYGVYHVVGIFKREGNMLTICFEFEPRDRPSEFRTTPDAGILIVWELVN
jgi:uncharacterized protein (TIGR03067 family)